MRSPLTYPIWKADPIMKPRHAACAYLRISLMKSALLPMLPSHHQRAHGFA
jgi:hypothetical protein